MRKLKINFLWRKIGKLTNPNQTFELNEHNHNEWTFTCRLYIKNVTLKFRLNEEFDETLRKHRVGMGSEILKLMRSLLDDLEKLTNSEGVE